MADLFNSFISKAFLRSVWALEFEAFKGSEPEGGSVSAAPTGLDAGSGEEQLAPN